MRHEDSTDKRAQAQARDNDATIIHRFIWRWAEARGIDPQVDGDIDNASWLDVLVSRQRSLTDGEADALSRVFSDPTGGGR